MRKHICWLMPPMRFPVSILVSWRRFSNIPDSKVHGAQMGAICGRQDTGGPHAGSMNFAIWDGYWLTGSTDNNQSEATYTFSPLLRSTWEITNVTPAVICEVYWYIFKCINIHTLDSCPDIVRYRGIYTCVTLTITLAQAYRKQTWKRILVYNDAWHMPRITNRACHPRDHHSDYFLGTLALNHRNSSIERSVHFIYWFPIFDWVAQILLHEWVRLERSQQ